MHWWGRWNAALGLLRAAPLRRALGGLSEEHETRGRDHAPPPGRAAVASGRAYPRTTRSGASQPWTGGKGLTPTSLRSATSPLMTAGATVPTGVDA